MRPPPSSSRSQARSRQHGAPAALLEPPQEIRPGLPLLPRLLQPPRPHSQVRSEYVPAVLPPVRQGHRFYQAGLSAGRMRLLPEAPGASLGLPDTSAASPAQPC